MSDTTKTVLTRCLGIAHFAWGFLLLYLLVQVWPVSSEASALEAGIRIFCCSINLSAGQRLLLIVVLSGMAGSFLHGANSFISFTGNSRFKLEWSWFFLLRPFLGAILAFGFYLVVCGGLLTVSSNSGSLNIYGIAAISFLAGMNSDQGIKKLVEVFGTMFRTQEPDPRGGKLQATLSITSIEPHEIPHGGQVPVEVVIKGTSFARTALLLINDHPHAVTWVSETELKASLLAADTATAGKRELVVINPPPNGRISEPFTITVT